MNIFFKTLKLFGIRTHRSFRLTIRAMALFSGLCAGFYVSVQLEQNNFQVGFYFFLIVIVASVLEFILGDMFADRSFPFDTERKLSLMEERLGSNAIDFISSRLRQTINEFVGCDSGSVSATVHVIAELNATNDSRTRYGLLQLTDYVGPEGGRKGRVTLINQGIIGRCARTLKMETADFSDVAEYKNSMVRDFGFTKEEARKHTITARSYLAYPLKSDEALIGVIYFFTEEPQVFPKAAKNAQLDRLATEFVNYLKLVQLA